MSNQYQCLRGMQDMVPAQSEKMAAIEATMANIAKQYGYQIINFPILESISLFQKSIGIETDIIGQEMYAFTDRNEDVIALRPEGTAGCLRSCLANGLIQRTKQKLFYIGPMFRRERPQRGRFRQFQHFGVEVYGYPSGGIDAELICMSHKMWTTLGIKNLTLTVNYLGSPSSRKKYHETLMAYWQKHMGLLSDAEKTRAINNPLRLLDSKNPALSALIDEAPSIESCLSDKEQQCYTSILRMLDNHGIQYQKSHRLVRGLDYYSDFIFEWISSDLGAQSTICGGGRYDPLTQSMGENIPAIGFAAGVDRIAEIIDNPSTAKIQIYIYAESPELLQSFIPKLDKARHSNAIINIDHASGKLKSKINAASTLNYNYVVIIQPEGIKQIAIESNSATLISQDEFLQWYASLNTGA